MGHISEQKEVWDIILISNNTNNTNSASMPSHFSLLRYSTLQFPWCIVNKDLIIIESNMKLLALSQFEKVVGRHILQIFLNHILETELEAFIDSSQENKLISITLHKLQYTIEMIQRKEYEHVLLVFIQKEIDTSSNETYIKQFEEEAFIQAISHELRTPLTIILGYIEYLLTNKNIKHFKNELNSIQQQGKRLHKTIDALAHLYFPEHFQQQLQKTTESVNNVITDFLQTQIKKEHTQRILFIPSKKNSTLTFKKVFLHIILHNLIDNALKFSSEPSKIIIKVESLKESIHIIIQDKGTGIPEHLQHKVFERFYSTYNTSDRFINGSGLGLAITKNILKAMDGEITLESQENKGTCVTLCFPKR